ncbi:membrane protein [Dokdonia pacifica]|uniref:DUF2723 domain-containing protein n=1 Tax=Dokdonia pacifica TaxID=1627892 RepID=A0A238VS28_9FLAO|nr:DUF2723 domain-containing protein [Dokdonia pacifica]GGG18305.1 membrane protein [Dokdonia pacifica]SNR36974.1 Protein of unknown function [Dokdonia pacifica]
MTEFNFKKWNKIVGWSVFAIALLVYSLTVEPTASFWDAGEYISTSSKLEIGHPPGAPLYQILGAFVSIFAPDSTYIALAVNYLSCLTSAFTILFMFWSLTLLIKKVLHINNEVITTSKQYAVLGSAAIGSLAFSFTDSFWFNAVEAEVYAPAAFILSVLFYLGLLWERDMHKPRGNRWLILIAFIVGQSFGIHFMGLLTIPAIGLLYYFKNTEKVTVKNFIIALVVVVAVLLFIFKFLLPFTLAVFGHLEVFFVNTIGLPFNSGTIIAGLIFTTLFYFGFTLSRKHNKPALNTALLCILFIFIGFSSWLMLPIRANAGTTINENNPNNARELLAYYNREQYPETKLFYGPQFTSDYSGLDPDRPYIDEKKKYEKDEKSGRYIIVNDWRNAGQNLDDAHKAFLPRMWSPEHNANYMQYTGPLKFGIKAEYAGNPELQEIVTQFKLDYAQGKVDYKGYNAFLKSEIGQYYLDVEKPSFGDNITYMFSYQFGYMYWRYFMWNFTGRQNDIQGQGDDFNGNWISGIDWIDSLFIGSQDNLPSDVLKNKARNTYFFLPLLLGLLGLLFHASKDWKNFIVLLVFFLFTGLALKVYLNERPFEPRERDYALVGSFYVFAMWIGFGAYALFDILKEAIKPKVALPIAMVVCLFAAPVLLAKENWDDHDRSGRKTALAMARKYLDSVDENAILFTIGDNDTFALWYVQEIEGYRTDVRVVNTSLINTDWYMDQMKSKAYLSDPVPSTLTHEKYRYGTRDAIFYSPIKEVDDITPVDKWLNWIALDDPRTQEELRNGKYVNTFPSKKIRIPVDKNAVLENNIVPERDAEEVVPYIDIELKSDILYKNRLLMMDILATNNWERPIYFTGGSFGDDDYLWMKDYLQLDGVCFKLIPIYTPVDERNPYEMGRIDSEKSYEIIKNWYWGNSGDPDIYHDRETRSNAITYRGNIARVVEQLIIESQPDKAKELMDLAMEKMPVDIFEFYTLLEPYISGYYEIGETQKARDLWEQVATKYQEQLTYFSGLTENRQYDYAEEIITNIEKYRNLIDLLVANQDEELVEEKAQEFNNYLRAFSFFYDDDEEENIESIEDILNDDSISIPADTTESDTTLKN